MAQPQNLAVFDFDDTLVHGDTMWTFLALVAGWPAFVLASTATALLFIYKHFLLHDARLPADRKTFFKQQMLKRLLAGRRVESLREPTARLRSRLTWNETMRRTLQEHYDKGDRVVVATGSLNLYLPELFRDVPHHQLLMTDVEIVDGIVTGVLHHGNCVRQGKADRVAAYMREQGPFGDTYGYGNFPDDVPMLNLMKYRVIV